MSTMRRRPSTRTPAKQRTRRTQHGHARARCLKILRQLSGYVDDELPAGICREIRKHLGACPNCEVFLESLRQTVTLCRHAQPRPLSPTGKLRIRKAIFSALRSR